MRPPSEDEFRALARSSPWLFTTLHFTRRQPNPAGPDGSRVKAWLARPGRLVVIGEDERRHVVTGAPYTKGYLTSDGSRRAWTASPPQDHAPVLRPDGLVAERPDSFEVDYDDPLWGSYDWVAMLDPVELSVGTRIDDLAATDRRNRRTWWATISAVAGYTPRCSCCPLLWGEASEILLAGEPGDGGWSRVTAPAGTGVSYPAHWLVGLDRATGVVVSCEPVGGSRRDLGFTVVIHAVDAPMADSLFDP